MIAIKQQFDALNVPKEIVEFDNDLADLVVKRLMKVPIEELERFYRDCTLVQIIQDKIELEKRYPTKGPFEKLPHCYI